MDKFVTKHRLSHKSIIVKNDPKHTGKKGVLIGFCYSIPNDEVVKVLLDNDPIAKQIKFSNLEIIPNHI